MTGVVPPHIGGFGGKRWAYLRLQLRNQEVELLLDIKDI